MILERLGGPLPITVRDCIHDSGVFLQRLNTPSRGGARRARHQRHGPVNEVQLLDEKPVVTGEMDLVVEPAVGPRKGLRIIEKCLIRGHHLTQHLDFFLRRVLGRELCGEPLQLLAHNIKLRHLGVVEGGDDQRPTIAR